MTRGAIPYEAVILAAGRGSRLASKTGEMPKAILPIGPRSSVDGQETNFLRRQVELLAAAGVERVVVVVGYLREMIIEEMKSWQVKPQLVVNPTPEIQTSGSLHSFQYAVRAGLGVLSGTHQTLLMDADIVYHPQVLAALLAAPAQSTLLISAGGVEDEEQVLVYGSYQRPLFLGKGLRPSLVNGAPCLGEATGIVKFSPSDHPLARQTIDWMLGDPDAAEGSLRHRGFGPARRATEHEELSQRFCYYGRMRAVPFAEGLPFMEVDSAEEYARLRNELYPALLAREEER